MQARTTTAPVASQDPHRVARTIFYLTLAASTALAAFAAIVTFYLDK